MTVSREGIPQFIGARIRRREDPALITGQGKYVADIHLDGALHMAVLRSPCAHATIIDIDTSEAEALTGVVAAFTGDDINPHLAVPLPMVVTMGEKYSEKRHPRRYPLTTDKVRHVGEPVAIVVAEDQYIAADAVVDALSHLGVRHLDMPLTSEKIWQILQERA